MRGALGLVALSGVLLTGCSDLAHRHHQQPEVSPTVRAEPDRLPDLSPLLSVERARAILGADTQPDPPVLSAHKAWWEVSGGANGLATLRVTVERARTTELARRFHRGTVDLWNDTRPYRQRGSDEAIVSTEFGLAFAARVGNVALRVSVSDPSGVSERTGDELRDLLATLIDPLRR
ncbi:hypothetical protein [Amycolatopsis cihanbeyliensis]|uniref:Lipoprotein n=1 Tax=Amycolatopsis cihanbeyliensis TaxID=1128664 RepID=A0A542DLC0_AMYCI|nr:hypothetical protein [Amycolatopsis cihanbeyliensis]TQJ03886.1 hypothetical protein FB471_3660 [Amycolatopsis cihanbeyliensis]